MKTKKLKLAASIIIMAALVVCGFTLRNASAANTGGNALLYTYYDVRTAANGGLGLTDNYFTVTNTSTDWVQAHVRVRTGARSVELLDFDVLLSPKDVFGFDLYRAASGGVEFASCDTHTLTNSGFDVDGNGCVIYDAIPTLIETCTGETAEQAIADTEDGYVEVIGEGAVEAIPGTTKCDDGNSGSTIPGSTLYDLNADGCDILALNIDNALATPLEGRVYYGTVTNGVVKRLAFLNAEVTDSFNQYEPILHADTIVAELTRCQSDDGCFAYGPATSNSVTLTGATDMNYCFYNTGTDAATVINRFGAAATFGPTLADLDWTPRDGSLDQTAHNLSELSENFSKAIVPYDAGDIWDLVNKQYADSHFFNAPALGAETSFAFIFPFQHFINETDSIAAVSVYDTEENPTTIQQGKFISPGLPPPTVSLPEASLHSLTSDAPMEGWIRWAVTASNPTCDNNSFTTDPTDDDVRCEASGYTYVPGYTGAVVTQGADALGVSLFDYNNDYVGD